MRGLRGLCWMRREWLDYIQRAQKKGIGSVRIFLGFWYVYCVLARRSGKDTKSSIFKNALLL